MNHTPSMCAPASEESAFGDSAAFRVVGLRTIETTLVKARADAERIGEPVIAYFIDMAIAEVTSNTRPQKESSCRRGDDKTRADDQTNVIQLIG
jgi:hypothetical protein